MDRYTNDKKQQIGAKKQSRANNKKSWQSDIAEPVNKLSSDNYQKKQAPPLPKPSGKMPELRQSKIVGRGASTDQKTRPLKANQLKAAQLPPSIRQSLNNNPGQNYQSTDALSEQNARSQLRAQQIDRKVSQNKQRQMSGILSMHDRKIN